MDELNPTTAGAPQEESAVDFDRAEPRAGLIAAVSVISVLILVAFCGGIYWLYTVYYEQVEYEQFTGVASKELIAIHEREDEQLHEYTYINEDKGIVRLPVERAMELVEADARQGKVSWNTRTYRVQPELPGGAAGMNWSADGTGAAQPVAK